MTIHSANSDTVCDIQKIARQVSSGDMSSIEKFEEALHLKNVTDIQMGEFCAIAAGLRDQGKGTVITFSPKVFLPLTRLCRDFCGYCTFRQDPSESKTLYLTPDEILSVVKEGEKLGCTEALFTLGERPEQRYSEAKQWLNAHGYNSTLEYLADMCRLVVSETGLIPHVNPGTMTRKEMSELRPYCASMGIMLESTSRLLYASGGPHEFAPSKRPVVRLKTTDIAGDLCIPFTSGILIGIGESRSDRIESLVAIANLHRKHGHIQEIIIQNFRAKPNTTMRDSPDADSVELLWTIAVCRILLGKDANIQVPPNLSANDYQIYLTAGINDWGGVSPLTIDYVNPEAPWPSLKDLSDKTERMGFSLKPRLPVYPEYFLDTDRYVAPLVREKLLGMSDKNGYFKGGIHTYVESL
ncbi:MAG: 7,8-didemethyl-8-hydroxy-5-deazariboflavin synthase CofG [Chloroflexota bacterium]|nr:7,8-didemethyl-8-hydroxy-5-deazariboflavin synthase CofG [Chloroflexota bacterium]